MLPPALASTEPVFSRLTPCIRLTVSFDGFERRGICRVRHRVVRVEKRDVRGLSGGEVECDVLREQARERQVDDVLAATEPMFPDTTRATLFPSRFASGIVWTVEGKSLGSTMLRSIEFWSWLSLQAARCDSTSTSDR